MLRVERDLELVRVLCGRCPVSFLKDPWVAQMHSFVDDFGLFPENLSLTSFCLLFIYIPTKDI